MTGEPENMDDSTSRPDNLAADPGRPLWAPWRIEYFKHIDDRERCFLCDNRHDHAPEHELVVARGQTAYLIMNGFPYNSGHILVAPNRHVGDLSDLEREEREEMFDLILRIKAIMKRIMRPDGFNFGFNLGAAAGAGLRDHVHGHLVPRWFGDTNFMPVIGNLRVVPQALEDTARLLRQAWREESEP